MSDGGDSGDAVCWLGMLCPECGAMPSEGADHCWRCGAPPERSGGESTQRRVDEEREAT